MGREFIILMRLNFQKNDIYLVKGCNSNPCKNGFTCLSNGNGTYTCNCKKS